jgi:hypothetical protein
VMLVVGLAVVPQPVISTTSNQVANPSPVQRVFVNDIAFSSIIWRNLGYSSVFWVFLQVKTVFNGSIKKTANDLQKHSS